MSIRKILQPRDTIIEKVAGELAATFYEIGRSQGLTSKYKTARLYARANLEKFIPKAVETLIDCLNSPNLNKEAKDTIYNAIIDRVNDPTNITSADILPDIDVKKLINLSPEKDKINDKIAQLMDRKEHKDLPPYIAKRH